jgi:undecaprenyl-diphosphatase
LDLLQGMIFGALQGLIEWLPVSSEGITTLVSINFLKIPVSDAISFSVWLHLGTLISAIFYFRRDLLELIKHFPDYLKDTKSEDGKTKITTFLILSTIFTGIVGLPIFLLGIGVLDAVSPKIATTLIGLFLIVTGIIQKRSREGEKETLDLQKRDGVLLGILQGFSALPGISRSGITTSTLLFKKFNPETALKLSFLMSIPAIMAAEVGLGILQGIEFSSILAVSILFSFLFGLLSIGVLLKVARKTKFWKFCIFLGLIAMLSILF